MSADGVDPSAPAGRIDRGGASGGRDPLPERGRARTRREPARRRGDGEAVADPSLESPDAPGAPSSPAPHVDLRV